MTDQIEQTQESIVADDPIVSAILSALADDKTPTFQDVARAIAESKRKPKDGPNLWRRYMTAVKQQATHLAKTGRIQIIRKGEVADPSDFRGIVRMRLPR